MDSSHAALACSAVFSFKYKLYSSLSGQKKTLECHPENILFFFINLSKRLPSKERLGGVITGLCPSAF